MIESEGKKYFLTREFGERIGKSRQSIGNWVKSGRLSGYVRMIDGVTYISEDALDDPGVLCPSRAGKTQENQAKQSANSDAQVFTSFLLAEIDRLRAEIEAKESVIADLRSQLDAHTERLAAITEESQRLVREALDTAKNAQTLQAASMLPPPASEDPSAVEAEPDPDVTGYDAGGGSWIRRIFGKK